MTSHVGRPPQWEWRRRHQLSGAWDSIPPVSSVLWVIKPVVVQRFMTMAPQLHPTQALDSLSFSAFSLGRLPPVAVLSTQSLSILPYPLVCNSAEFVLGDISAPPWTEPIRHACHSPLLGLTKSLNAQAVPYTLRLSHTTSPCLLPRRIRRYLL